MVVGTEVEIEVKRRVGINMAIHMEEEFLLVRVLQNGFQRMPWVSAAGLRRTHY